MPFSFANLARLFVRFAIAALVAAYASNPSLGSNPWIDVLLMMLAPGFSTASAACVR